MDLNRWNRIRYTFYQPVYDVVAGLFSRQRKKSIKLLKLSPLTRVLILGAGTGLDLPYLTECRNITAIDITPAMISKLELRARRLGLNVDARVMDGQHLEFQDESFDVVIMHLILAVIPDPYRCVKEAERVLAHGGRAVIFDKFLPEDATPSQVRQLANKVSGFLFSEINRKAEEIIGVTGLKTELDMPAAMGGMFRIIKLKKD